MKHILIFQKNKLGYRRLEIFPNLIIVQTLSKAYGLAGIRIGFVMHQRDNYSVLNYIKPPYNVNELSQQRAISRLQQMDEVRNEVAQLISERKRLKKS